jgi:hypothetical protein
VSGANTKNLAKKDDFSNAIADLLKDITDFKFDLSDKITNALRWSFLFCGNVADAEKVGFAR